MTLISCQSNCQTSPSVQAQSLTSPLASARFSDLTCFSAQHRSRRSLDPSGFLGWILGSVRLLGEAFGDRPTERPASRPSFPSPRVQATSTKASTEFLRRPSRQASRQAVGPSGRQAGKQERRKASNERASERTSEPSPSLLTARNIRRAH